MSSDFNPPPEPGFRADRNDYPPSRRGCSCWLVALIIAALGLSGAIFGFVALDSYVENRVFGKLSAAEIADYEKWMNSPVEIRPELLVSRPPLPASVKTQRHSFFEKAKSVESKVGEIFVPCEYWDMNIFGATGKTSPTIYQNLVNAHPLTADQQTTLALHLPLLRELAADAAALTQNPDYLLNDRPAVVQFLLYAPESAILALSAYAITEADAGRWKSAIAVIDTAASLVRRDPQYRVSSDCAKHQRLTAHALAKRTSDTAVLRQILSGMLIHRERIVSSYNIFAGNPDPLFLIAHQMMKDGYKRQLPRVRGGYFEVQYDYPDYMVWIKNRPGDLRAMLISDYEVSRMRHIGHDSAFHFFSAIDIGILKPAAKQLTLALSDSWYLQVYLHEKQSITSFCQAAAEYDTFCIELARRIAGLDGKPAPTTPEEISPVYIPEFPHDPFGTGPMPWNPKLSLFYSIGEDGTAGTTDDVFYDSNAKFAEDELFFGLI